MPSSRLAHIEPHLCPVPVKPLYYRCMPVLLRRPLTQDGQLRHIYMLKPRKRGSNSKPHSPPARDLTCHSCCAAPTTIRLVNARFDYCLVRQGANAQLRGRVQELAGELQDAREELAALGGLQEQLAAEVADDVDVDALVETALARERAAQDARNRKVLELLKSKVCGLLLRARVVCSPACTDPSAYLAASNGLWLLVCEPDNPYPACTFLETESLSNANLVFSIQQWRQSVLRVFIIDVKFAAKNVMYLPCSFSHSSQQQHYGHSILRRHPNVNAAYACRTR